MQAVSGGNVATDVLIVGGGPGGAVLARRLAAAGQDVALVTAPRPPAWEGMSPRVVEGFRRASCSRAIAAAGEPARRTAHWNGLTSDLNSEHVVERPLLDAALLRDAAEAGVRIVEAGVAGLSRGTLGWEARDATGALLAAGGFLVEARGRRAPQVGPATDSGPRSVAIGRLYTGTAGAAASSAASFADGWAWMAALPDGRRLVQFVVDAAMAPRRDGLTVLHAALAETVPEAAAWVAGATPAGEASARDATSVLRSGLVGPDHLRVGDAAFAVDPLSGHGVYEALGGAFAATAAIRTLLFEADSLPLVRRFVEQRCADLFAHAAALGQAFYRQESRWPDRPFWRDRCAWPPGRAPRPSAPSIEPRAVVVGDRIAEREVLVTPGNPRGVLTIEDIELAPLLRMTREQGVDARLADRLGCEPARLETALAWLRRNGFLGPEDAVRR